MKFRIRRLMASFIDVILCAFLAALFSVLPAYLASGLRLGFKVMLLLLAVMTCVFFIFRDVFDGSIGKKIMRIKIVDWEGNRTGFSARIKRNLTVILFPIEFIMIFGGYDTLGDTLACTCVVDRGAKGTPGMKKGNNLLRNIAILLILGAIGGVVTVYLVRSMRITGSDGYDALESYMRSPEVIEKYGEDPVWKAESVTKEEDTCIYDVTVNGQSITVKTVNINDRWFTTGIQTETIDKLSAAIEKFVGEKTLNLSVADLNRDGKPELIEFCMGDNKSTVCNIYDIEQQKLSSSFQYDNGGAGSVGEWILSHDLNGSDKMIIRLSGQDSNLIFKQTCVIDYKLDKYSLNTVFEEKYLTCYKKDEEGESQRYFEVELLYNGREITPADYFDNLNNFEERFTPVSGNSLYSVRWDNDGDGLKDQAFKTAVKLVEKGWE